jgi:hypothetical protein
MSTCAKRFVFSVGNSAKHRWRLNENQRRRLTFKAKGLRRKLLAELATIVTSETLLRWHRKLIAEIRAQA